MTRSLVGTPRGATRCAACRHTRQRHTASGAGPCAGIDYAQPAGGTPAGRYVPVLCRCAAFTEQ